MSICLSENTHFQSCESIFSLWCPLELFSPFVIVIQVLVFVLSRLEAERAGYKMAELCDSSFEEGKGRGEIKKEKIMRKKGREKKMEYTVNLSMMVAINLKNFFLYFSD